MHHCHEQRRGGGGGGDGTVATRNQVEVQDQPLASGSTHPTTRNLRKTEFQKSSFQPNRGKKRLKQMFFFVSALFRKKITKKWPLVKNSCVGCEPDRSIIVRKCKSTRNRTDANLSKATVIVLQLCFTLVTFLFKNSSKRTLVVPDEWEYPWQAQKLKRSSTSSIKR